MNAAFEKAMAKIQAALATAAPGNIFYDKDLPDGPMAQAVSAERLILVSSKP
jgi:hypothetical protein